LSWEGTVRPYLCQLHFVKYRVIHKSFQNFQTLLCNNQDRHSRKEHIIRWIISPVFFFRDETWRGQGIRQHSVSWNLPKTESILMVQWMFWTMYHTEPCTDKTISEWYVKFQQSGCLCTAKRTGRLGPSSETVEHVRETFVRSPQKSTHCKSQEFQMPQSSVWRILHKCLHVRGYWLQLLQVLNPQDHNLHFHFCVDFQQRLEEDRFAEKLIFSDEVTFHVCVVR